jgi:hypothetical protein
MTTKAVKPHKNDDAIEPGCPQCGRGGAHAHSSPPVAIVVKPITVVVKAECVPESEISDGQFLYERWVSLVGHGIFAVSWQRLGSTQSVWATLAKELEERKASKTKVNPR